VKNELTRDESSPQQAAGYWNQIFKRNCGKPQGINPTGIKRYDKPKTPYERVLESKHISVQAKCYLKEQFSNLNPFRLRKTISRKLKKIFDIQCQKSLSVDEFLR